VFQRGEVLAYLRFVMTRVYPVSSANPQMRTVRFSFGSVGNLIDKHSMDDLAAELLIEAAKGSDLPKPLPQSGTRSQQQHWIYWLLDRIHGM